MRKQKTVVQPLGWNKPSGFSNGIVAEGRMLFVAGQVGWDPRSPKKSFPKAFADQFDQALSNVCDVVREAGGVPEDIVRLTVYVTDKREYLGELKQIGASHRRRLGKYFPAMALVQVSALVEDDARVEIEATAVL